MRIDYGSHPHCFSSSRDYHHHLYFEAWNLLLREIPDRFDQQEVLPPVLGLESLLIKAANGEAYGDVLHNVEQSCYAPDLDFTVLRRQLPLLVDVVKQGCSNPYYMYMWSHEGKPYIQTYFFRSTQIAEALSCCSNYIHNYWKDIFSTETTAYLLIINLLTINNHRKETQ